MDNDGSTITRCTGNQDSNCNVWETCVNRTALGVTHIAANSTYTIRIETGDQFHILCSSNHGLSFHAQVTLHCDAVLFLGEAVSGNTFGNYWLSYGKDKHIMTIQIGSYGLWIIVTLMVINIICLIVYCWNKREPNEKKGYRVIRYDTDVTDI